jgi:hypothetical protein
MATYQEVSAVFPPTVHKKSFIFLVPMSSREREWEVQINLEPPLYKAGRKDKIPHANMELDTSYKEYNRRKEAS